MSVEIYRESPGKIDSRTLNRETLSRWTGRMIPRAGRTKFQPRATLDRSTTPSALGQAPRCSREQPPLLSILRGGTVASAGEGAIPRRPGGPAPASRVPSFNGYLVLQGSVPLRTSHFKHVLKLLARKRLGTRWAKYPLSRCREGAGRPGRRARAPQVCAPRVCVGST